MATSHPAWATAFIIRLWAADGARITFPAAHLHIPWRLSVREDLCK